MHLGVCHTEPMTITHTAPTCTVRFAHGVCGKPAVYTEGDFAECAECAAHPAALAKTRHIGKAPKFVIGEAVEFEAHGFERRGTVTKVGRTRVTVEFFVGREGHRRPIERIFPAAKVRVARV